jgi:hypothetical protein
MAYGRMCKISDTVIWSQRSIRFGRAANVLCRVQSATVGNASNNRMAESFHAKAVLARSRPFEKGGSIQNHTNFAKLPFILQSTLDGAYMSSLLRPQDSKCIIDHNSMI